MGIVGGLYFLAFQVAILLVIRWCFQNDNNGSSTGSHGIFAMRPPADKPQLKPAGKRFNRSPPAAGRGGD